MTTQRNDYLLIPGYWIALLVGFWIVQADWPWNVLFPLTGFLWMGGPLVLTKRKAEPLIAFSAVLLLGLVVWYLFAVLAALAFLGFFGSLIFEMEEASPGGMGGILAVEGLKVFTGAIAGVVAGMAMRHRDTSGFDTPEPDGSGMQP